MNVHVTPQGPLLDLDLLKTLVAIAETGNFSTAAEVVFRTPSAVSMQVKRIEEIVGRPVFNREARTVSLNEDGELLLAHARRVLALNRDVLAHFTAPNISGTVHLGALDHAVDQFLPSILCCFAETHPGIRVDVTVENSSELLAKYQKADLDLAIITGGGVTRDHPDMEILFKEALVWAGLKNGVAVEQKPLPVSVWEEGCVWRAAALNGLHEQSKDYRINFMSAHVAAQKAGILADLVVAPLPLSACQGDIIPLGSKYDLPELPDYTMGLLINKDVSEPVRAVADHLRVSLSQRSGPI